MQFAQVPRGAGDGEEVRVAEWLMVGIAVDFQAAQGREIEGLRLKGVVVDLLVIGAGGWRDFYVNGEELEGCEGGGKQLAPLLGGAVTERGPWKSESLQRWQAEEKTEDQDGGIEAVERPIQPDPAHARCQLRALGENLHGPAERGAGVAVDGYPHRLRSQSSQQRRLEPSLEFCQFIVSSRQDSPFPGSKRGTKERRLGVLARQAGR